MAILEVNPWISGLCLTRENYLLISSMRLMTSGVSSPFPIRNRIPAMQRTWCIRNALPVIVISHMSYGEGVLCVRV